MVVRLILCFDGTWDRPDPNSVVAKRVESNVVRFHESIFLNPLPDGSLQVPFYDTGVGTNWYDRVIGGAFGFGIDQKIQDGYQWLVDKYDRYESAAPGSCEVFVLGFSRGAYTARSLVGMIRNVGLLYKANSHRVEDAYRIYRNRDVSADTDQAKNFRDRYSRSIQIKFLGVWDTVGALGIPLSELQWLNAAAYAFHDTELSGIVQNAAHAVAIDEHRVDYQVALWDRVPKAGQIVEQRWFAGAHVDVGGGYDSRLLSDITLKWMQDKAAAAGLIIDQAEIPLVAAANSLGPIHDSYGEFLGGVYALTHKPPYYRPMQVGPGGNEVVDQSARDRVAAGIDYAPPNDGFSG